MNCNWLCDGVFVLNHFVNKEERVVGVSRNWDMV